MLSKEDNELMCRVGPGTPMGNLIRQYWIPALIPSELPEADGPPLRLRLLGENLIGFRVTSGKVGIIADSCPHRGTSMFYGRNEAEGLRCAYHGWKFDVDGNCVDMMSEPPESDYKLKVKATTYPCVERNGIIWTYMGPRETPPPLPEFAPNLDENCRINKRLEECNYMQALEGDIDTVHAGILHGGHVVADRDRTPGTPEYYAARIRHARFESYDHEIGATYAAVRPAEEGTEYWRTGHYLLPFFTMNAPGILTLKNSGQAWVPLDDYNTMVWLIGLQFLEPGAEGIGGLKEGRGAPDPVSEFDPYERVPKGEYIYRQYLPPTSDWLGRFRPIANKENDYAIDRELQRSMEWDPTAPVKGTYSGVPRAAQDPMAQESMGAIYDRSQEHLSASDSLVIRARAKLINAAKALRDHGTIPPGVDNPELFRMRSGGAILPEGVDGLEVLRGVHFFKADTVALTVEAQAGGAG